MATPTISSQAGLSPSTSSAPTSVHAGAVARIGDAMDAGRCLTAKYVATHEHATMQDFNAICPCCLGDSGVTVKSPGSRCGWARCSSNRVVHKLALTTLARNSTGSTAFLGGACLVQSSYRPRKKAATRLAVNQCIKGLTLL